ncbi:MAG TPA: MMPL family transporter, partial [Polyangia bacterium]|nr:MMPL family transporter [Polyangia bacterium]
MDKEAEAGGGGGGDGDGGDGVGGRGARVVAGLLARPARVLAAAAILALAATALASRLSLRTAFTELLPSRDPAVLALRRTETRVGNLNLMTVAIRSPDRAANLRYAAALTEALRRLPRSEVDLAAYHLRDLQAFFHDNRWLYAGVDDLESARDRLRREIGKRKNPLFVSVGDDARDDQALRKRLDRSPVTDRFPDGYFVRDDVAWVIVLPASDIFGEHAGEALVDAVDAFTAAHPPPSFHPAMRVQCLGPVITAIENRRAIEQDIIGVTIFCTLLVALSMILYFRQLRSVVLVVAAAALGTVIAFATGEIAFGYLNSTTAFLGSIILGNGINHPIVLLSRIRELLPPRPATASGAETTAAVRAAVAGTGRATLTAALAAAAAYLSLTLTSFRGFSQFGVMAAAGSLACWAAAYSVIPAWLVWRARAGGTPLPSRPPTSLGRLSRLLLAWSPELVAAAALITVAALFALRHFASAPFEYDFRRLRADVARTPERKMLDDNMGEVFGRWPSPIIVLADRLSQVEPIKAAILAKDSPTRPVIGQVATVYDVLPGTPEVQARKLALLGEIRRLTDDPALQTLSDKQRDDVARLRPPDNLRVLEPRDLPPLARRPFTET